MFVIFDHWFTLRIQHSASLDLVCVFLCWYFWIYVVRFVVYPMSQLILCALPPISLNMNAQLHISERIFRVLLHSHTFSWLLYPIILFNRAIFMLLVIQIEHIQRATIMIFCHILLVSFINWHRDATSEQNEEIICNYSRTI